jgi:hypothetical protein
MEKRASEGCGDRACEGNEDKPSLSAKPVSPSLSTTMSHGPPTPPPTSQTEIMDIEKDEAAKAAAATVTSTETAPPTATDADAPTAAAIDSYQQLLPTIADLAAQQQYEELVRVAELADLNVCLMVRKYGAPITSSDHDCS